MQQAKAAAFFENGIGNFILFTSAIQAISQWWCGGGPVDLILRSDFKDSRIGGIKAIASELEVINKIVDWPDKDFDVNDYKFRFRSLHGGGGYNIPGFIPISGVRLKWVKYRISEAEWYVYELFQHGYRGDVPYPIFPRSENKIRLNPDKVHIALCNGTFKTKEWLKKQWPEEHWKKLIKSLENRGYQCWWVGGNSDVALGGRLLPDERMLAGKLSMVESGGFIEQCDAIVSTDTAIAHAAGALNLDQVVLWGGTLLSKNYPINQHGIVKIARARGLGCSPCLGQERFLTCTDYRCMNLIEPKMVEKSIDEILSIRGLY